MERYLGVPFLSPATTLATKHWVDGAPAETSSGVFVEARASEWAILEVIGLGGRERVALAN